jgi:LysM repeat protein
VTVTVSPSPSATTTPSPSPSAPATTPPPAEPAPVEEPELVPNPAVGEPIPNAPAPIVEPGPAVDLGEAPGARGVATTNDDGSLNTYTVVEGDSFFDIAQRFDVPVQQFLHMNPSVPGLGEDIYIKQIINLDWTTKR